MVRFTSLLWAGISLFSFGAPLAANADDAVVTWKDDVKGWYLGVDRSIGGGCFMYGSYDGGTFLRFQFNPEGRNMELLVGNEKWASLEEGKLYEIAITFGKKEPWTGEATATIFADMPTLVMGIPFEDDRAYNFTEELRRTSGVKIAYQGRVIEGLELSGSFAAVAELLECQSAVMSMEDEGGESDDPFSSSSQSGEDPFR